MAPGRNILSDRTKVIQPLERSVVQRILVKDGDHVQAGQPLVELDPTTAQADKASLLETRKAAQSDWLRAQILQKMLSKQELSASTHQAVDAKKSINQELHQDTLADWIHANQDRSRERIELERDLATQQARLQEAQAALRETEQTRSAYLAETRRTLSERQAQAELKRHQTGQELIKATQREQLATLTAPVSGTVQQLALHTEGGGSPGIDGHRSPPQQWGSQRQRRGHAGEQGHRVCSPGAGGGHQAGDLPLHKVQHRQSQRGQGHAGRGE